MSTIQPEMTIGQLVQENPARARVFETLRIDYCCGGKVSLLEACRDQALDPQELVRRLEQCDATPEVGDAFVDAGAMDLAELADHIEQTHHAYLKRELPRLDVLAEKVARAHSDREPRLLIIRNVFLALRAELEPHMLREERVLFPMIRALDGAASSGAIRGGTVADPIRRMEQDHDQAGGALAILREATDGFTPPDWACNTYCVLLEGLAELEGNMHQHVHKENNVLFPKAIELERTRPV